MQTPERMRADASQGPGPTTRRLRIHLSGRVQGVGFRPTVYRVATCLGLTGLVRNDGQGLTIEVQGSGPALDAFIERIRTTDRPPLASIEAWRVDQIPVVLGDDGFHIEASDLIGDAGCEVCPDVAVCKDCLAEMSDPTDRRFQYPFINCTNCGPRYTIVVRIPYDRPNTTMAGFVMCPECRKEYEDVRDRRFHAQPVACPACGPRVWLVGPDGHKLCKEGPDAIDQAAAMLRAGRIVAVKGIGGFHLMVDACNDDAVRQLRQRKRRDHKPFAMMAASIKQVARHAQLCPPAVDALLGPQAPIVLLPKRKDHGIANSVAQGVATFGFMMCYAPVHHLLLPKGPGVVVATSGNISDEPLICDNDMALRQLAQVADAFLMHDRPIFRQVDDSVVQIIDRQPMLIRRARGYVPEPIFMRHGSSHQILALGADLKNTPCLVKGNQLICSEHIGDLADAEVFRHYLRSIAHLEGLFDIRPSLLACDMHPGYVSTSYAQKVAGRFKMVLQVQHHWAHLASVLAEHQLDGPVIGLIADGTGYGPDGAIWGCECLVGDLRRFDRLAHLEYYPLPGGDKAAKEAIRPLMGLLTKVAGPDLRSYQDLLDLAMPDRQSQQVIYRQLGAAVNTVQTSSLGRLFDAVACLLGLGTQNHYDGQLPMALEAIAWPDVSDGYPVTLTGNQETGAQLSLMPFMDGLLNDLKAGLAPGLISARFHNVVAKGLLEMAIFASRTTGLRSVAISGGVFCNRYLTERVIGLLRQAGLEVYWNRRVPANDGGISVGQAAIASSLVGDRL
ncbi:MAG: carbamoyltransferase HypF [Sedimentisphaerales bacterium]|nr:carbamoyltransferase HypF [Sedimentisphaerales bacterium]